MRLGVPFIVPRQLGAVESNPGKQILPSVDWCTGQSGAPPDTVRCRFLSYSKPTIDDLEPLAHWTLSGAHRTVRCPLLAVGSATRRAWIKRPTVGPATVGSPDTVWCTPDSPVNSSSRWLVPRVTHGFRGRPLARPTVGSPDSPVNYSRTSLITSREQQVRLSQPGAPDTVWCPTGQSGAPRQS